MHRVKLCVLTLQSKELPSSTTIIVIVGCTCRSRTRRTPCVNVYGIFSKLNNTQHRLATNKTTAVLHTRIYGSFFRGSLETVDGIYAVYLRCDGTSHP